MPIQLTEFLAIYGAVISTLSLAVAGYLAWLRYKQTRKSLRVEASYGMHQTEAGPNPAIVLVAMNTGFRPFSIEGAFIEANGLLLGGGEISFGKRRRFKVVKQGIPMWGETSKRIEQGDRATIKFAFNPVREATAGKQITGIFVVDGEENWHYAELADDLKVRLDEPFEERRKLV